jgi:hypothetical protein
MFILSGVSPPEAATLCQRKRSEAGCLHHNENVFAKYTLIQKLKIAASAEFFVPMSEAEQILRS